MAPCPVVTPKLPPRKVKPSMIDPAEPLRSSSVLVVGTSGVTIASLATRPRASTPHCAPRSVTLLARTTFSMYVPGQTVMMAPVMGAAFTAAWIDVYGAIGQSKWSSSTTNAGSAITKAIGRTPVGVSVRSQLAPSHATAGKVKTAATLRSVCIGVSLKQVRLPVCVYRLVGLVAGPFPDQRPIDVDVVEHRQTKEIRSGIGAFIENDRDRLDHIRGENGWERHRELCSRPAKSHPRRTDRQRDQRRRRSEEHTSELQ